jgi:cell division protein FtsA
LKSFYNLINMRDKVISGLDIGSTAIRLVVGQISPGGLPRIIGGAECPSEGVVKGTINSIEDTVSSISRTLEKTERMTGIPLRHAYVAISGVHIISQDSKGVVAVARADGEIREEDVERSLEAAQTVVTPTNYEILHVIPQSFIVDNQSGIKDPVGMMGVRLEVEAQIIEGLSSQIKNLTKAVYRTGLDIDDLVFSPLACAEALTDKQQKELGVVVLNLGGATTSLAVFEEGDLLLAKVLPIGSSHITSDIAIGLRSSIDLAEQIKLEVGTCLPAKIGKREEINLADFQEGDEEKVSLHHIAEIIEARVEEIFKLVDKELQKIGRSGKLPAGVILTGGGAKLPGVVEVAKKIFRLPASLGSLQGLSSPIDKINDPSFSTACGLIVWGSQLEKPGRFSRFFTGLPRIGGVIEKIKKWFRGLIP